MSFKRIGDVLQRRRRLLAIKRLRDVTGTFRQRGQQLLEQLWSEPVTGDVQECALIPNPAVLVDVPGTGQSHAPAGVLHRRIAAAVIDQSLYQRTPPSRLDRLLEHPVDVKALAPGEQAEGWRRQTQLGRQFELFRQAQVIPLNKEGIKGGDAVGGVTPTVSGRRRCCGLRLASQGSARSLRQGCP